MGSSSRRSGSRNVRYNETVGQSVVGQTYLSPNFDAADFESRINGQYTGTTDEIIQWGSYKWGFDEDIVRAQAYTESTWFAGKLGDCGENTQPETDGCASVGIMQVRSANLEPVFPGVWSESRTSTAFNIDYALAIKRACFEGREVWLTGQGSAGETYISRDEWGCMGRWFSGRWYDGGANEYLEDVQARLDERAGTGYVGCLEWETNFYCSGLGQ